MFLPLRRRLATPFAIVLAVLGSSGLVAQEGAKRSPPPQLQAVPYPPLEAMEVAVREQLATRQATLQALIRDPGRSDAEMAQAFGALAQLYLGYGLTSAARACLVNATALAPRVFRWHYYLGRLHQLERRLDSAVERFERSLELRPEDPPAILRLATVHLARRQPLLAKPLFERALELDRQSAAAHHGLGRVAFLRGHLEEATQHYRRALTLQPEASSLYYLLGQVYRDLGQLESSRTHLRQSGPRKVLFPDPWAQEISRQLTGSAAYITMGRLVLRQGAVETAESYFRRALASNPSSSAARQNLGQLLERQGKIEKAIDEYLEALRLEPGHPDLHYHLGGLLTSRGRDAEALRHLEIAVELAPAFRQALVALGRLEERTGERGEAAKLYRRALEIDPHDEALRVRLEQLLETQVKG